MLSVRSQITPSSESLGLSTIVTENNFNTSDDFGWCVKATWRPTCARKPGGQRKMFQHDIFQLSRFQHNSFEDIAREIGNVECAKCNDRVWRKFMLMHTVGSSTGWAVGSSRKDGSLDRNRRASAGMTDAARKDCGIWRRIWSESESLRKATWRPT